VYGDRDIYGSTTERLVSRYPGARVVVIPDCGHIPWLQNRQAFVDVVCRFLAS
jgi:pimeloyl-ACP methyl ester carboxylesterase